jgi:tetratricopeptide (TPR) repeat protein
LAPLSDGEASQFFGSDADPLDVAHAVAMSGGNPLFLAELARAGPRANAAPGLEVDTLIAERVGRLDQPERDLIVFAAATARDFRPELLGAAMGLPEPRLIERIDRLERRGLLRPSAEGRFDFVHDVIRRATYRSLSQPHRRMIHRQIARALDEAARHDPVLAGELAFHAGAAGEHALAVRACIEAGEHCLRIFANNAALDAADRGLGHLAQMSAGADRVRFHLALLKVKVFATASPSIRPRPELFGQLQDATETASLMGLDNDAALGSHLMAWSTQHANDAQGAWRATLQAERMSRTADDLARCHQLANTARCLLEVEVDVANARSFLLDAERLAGSLNENLVELDWARGLVARWDGDLGQAVALMRRALTLARLREDRWREIECLVWIAKIELERGAVVDAQAQCQEIDAVANRIGDSQSPVAEALRAVIALHDAGVAAEDLDHRLDALRAYDDKAQIAYILNHIATIDLRRSRPEAARKRASEALDAARAVTRLTEIVVASSLLARALLLLGDADGAAALLASIDAGGGNFNPLSARAREFLDQAWAEIPTLPQTKTY